MRILLFFYRAKLEKNGQCTRPRCCHASPRRSLLQKPPVALASWDARICSSSLSVWRSICGRSVDLILYGARANFTLHILVRCRISPWSLLNSLTPYAILVRCTLPLFFHGAKIVLFFMHTLRCCCGVSFPRLPVKGSWGTKITALVGDILALG